MRFGVDADGEQDPDGPDCQPGERACECSHVGSIGVGSKPTRRRT
jgi:hypothetical protein